MAMAKDPKPVRIAGDQAPDNSRATVVSQVVMTGEAVAMWQLTQLAQAWWLKVLAWVLLGIVVAAAAARPWLTRRTFALAMARWRALRRIQRIAPADFVELVQLQPTPQDCVAFNLGVLAVTERIGVVIAEEERRAGSDLKDGVA